VVCAAVASGQRLGKHVSAATDTNPTTEVRRFLCGPCGDVISKGQSLVDSELSSAREAVKMEPERVKVKNLHCYKPFPGNGRRKHSRLEKAYRVLW
jgi:hypothetical protein